jgi:hypothetical protein
MADFGSNALDAYWMPFTPNRRFKSDPRMVAGAKDMHYVTTDGRQILDGTAGLWCVNAGHSRPRIVEAIRRQAGDNVDQVKDIATLLRLVLSGRVDLIVISNYAGTWEIREQGMSEQLERQPFELASESPAHMAFSRVHANAAAQAAMTAGLAAMVRDGTVAQIESRYLADR